MDSLSRALADCDRMHAAASKAVATAHSLAATMPNLGPLSANLGKHQEQYRHFSGWTYVAVKTIATKIAGQPLYVGRIGKPPKGRKLHLPGSLKGLGDTLEPLASHALLSTLEHPNPLMVRWSLMFSSVGSLLLTGRAFWWLTEDQIWPIPSHWIEANDPLRGSWTLRPYGSAEYYTLPGEDVIPFTMPDPSDPFGAVSPLQAQALAVATDEQIQQAQHRAFTQGVQPDLMVRIGKDQAGNVPTLTDKQRQEIVSALVRRHGGPHGKHNPLVVDGLIQGVEKLSMSPQEMDFLDSGKSTKARILQSYGVNPIIAGEVEGANRASSYAAEEHFCESTINPLCDLLSQTLTRWLGSREGLVIWIEEARADDEELTLQAWKAARQSGDVTPNEYRRHVLNLPDVDGGDERVDALGNPIREFEPLSRLLEPSRNGHN